MDPHFNPLEWKISLGDYTRQQLESSTEAQAAFVHEYTHYVQSLTGTLGRIYLVELVRMCGLAAITIRYGATRPKLEEQLDILSLLRGCPAATLAASTVRNQYHDLVNELRFVLSDEPLVSLREHHPGDVVWLPRSFAGHHQASFPHIVAKWDEELLAVPITHRVLFENMARQIQRNYLYFSGGAGGNTASVDSRVGKSQLAYTCLHDALAPLVPSGESPAKFTIVLCHIAVRCRNPGQSFARMLAILTTAQPSSLDAGLDQLKRDAMLARDFNRPDLQQTLDELIQKWGTVMRLTENWELRELTKLLANASNDLLDNDSHFADPLVASTHVEGWVRRYGCPPVHCADGIAETVFGVKTTLPFQDYFAELQRLLA